MLTEISSTVFFPKIRRMLSPTTSINSKTGSTDHIFCQLGTKNSIVIIYKIAFVGLIPDAANAFVNSLIDINATSKTASFVTSPPYMITKKNIGRRTSADIILTFKIPLLTYGAESSISILIIKNCFI